MQLSNYRIRQMDDGSFNIPFIEFTFRQREGLESRSMVPPQRLGDFSRMSFELCEHRGMLRVTRAATFAVTGKEPSDRPLMLRW